MFEPLRIDSMFDFDGLVLPKFLFEHNDYIKLSAIAKIFYGLLLDRALRSQNDEATEPNECIAVTFSSEEVRERLRCSPAKVVKLFAELTDVGLIGLEDRGVGLPRLIKLTGIFPAAASAYSEI